MHLKCTKIVIFKIVDIWTRLRMSETILATTIFVQLYNTEMRIEEEKISSHDPNASSLVFIIRVWSTDNYFL